MASADELHENNFLRFSMRMGQNEDDAERATSEYNTIQQHSILNVSDSEDDEEEVEEWEEEEDVEDTALLVKILSATTTNS